MCVQVSAVWISEPGAPAEGTGWPCSPLYTQPLTCCLACIRDLILICVDTMNNSSENSTREMVRGAKAKKRLGGSRPWALGTRAGDRVAQ